MGLSADATGNQRSGGRGHSRLVSMERSATTNTLVSFKVTSTSEVPRGLFTLANQSEH